MNPLKAFFWMFFFSAVLWSSSAFSATLYNDPSGEEMREETIRWTLEDINKRIDSGDPKGEYVLGTVYLHGSSFLDVDKDEKKAFSTMKSLWGQGVADAGYYLFLMYYKGTGTNKNYKIAFKYLKESADMDYLLSQRTLADAYRGKEYEKIVSQSYDKAVDWYKKAADHGDKQSALALANLYYQGEGVEQSDKKAFDWLLRCSQLKYGYETLGFLSLAKFYEEGIGTDVDLVQAYKYYDLQGSAGAEGKQRLSKQMTKEQIEEARRQSLEWQKEHNVRIGGGFFQMN